MTRTLRPYQLEDVEKVYAAWERGVLRAADVSATGTGKTDKIAKIATDEVLKQRARGRKACVIILATRRELLGQIEARLKMHLPDVSVGWVQAQRNEINREVLVCSVATLAQPKRQRQIRNDPEQGLPNVVIDDECHHAVSPTHLEVLRWAGCLPTLDEATGEVLKPARTRLAGYTATMVRGDKRGLGDVWQEIVAERSIQWAIAHEWLVEPRGRCVVAQHMNLHAAKIRKGDFVDRELGDMISQDVGEIADAWLREAVDERHPHGRITAAYAPSIASAHALAQAFAERDVKAEVVIGATPGAERDQIYARLADGRTRVLVSVMVTTEGWDCLDEETEILTVAGWRGMGQVAAGDMVQSLNRDTGLLETVPVTRYVERPMNPGERMFTATSQHVDVRTSEGHEFHVRSRWSNVFQTVTGADLVQRRSPYLLPLAAPSTEPLKGLNLTDDEIRFVAWFMTDGGFNRTSVEISQAKGYKDDIRALLTRLGMDFTERVRQPGRGAYPNAKPLHVFVVPRGTHGGSLRRNGWDGLAQYLDKDVASVMHWMTRAQFLVFWEEMLKGDGDRGWLTCDRQSQVDAYTMMAITRGLSASYRTRTSVHGTQWFRVSIRDKQWIMSDPSDSRSAKLELSAPREGEQVWCVTNRNSTLVTRRNGKIAIIGNCPAVSCILLARPTRLLGLFTQIVGRGLRRDDDAQTHGRPAKRDCLVLDVVGASRYQKLITLVDLLPTAKRDTTALDAYPCPDCGGELAGGECQACAQQAEDDRAVKEPVAPKLIGRDQILGYEDVRYFQITSLPWLLTKASQVDQREGRIPRIRFTRKGDRYFFVWHNRSDDSYTAGWCNIEGDRTVREALDGAVRVPELRAQIMIQREINAYKGKLAKGKRADHGGRGSKLLRGLATAFGFDGDRHSAAAIADLIDIEVASARLDSYE